MSEETILKSSFLGGYNKEDVTKYIDSLIKEKDKRAKNLQEEIIALTKENNRLKNQLTSGKMQTVSDKSKRKENKPSLKEKAPQSLNQNIKIMGNLEGLSIREQMELPEGTYLVSKDHGVINLPDPSPSYKTKEKGNKLNGNHEINKDFLHEVVEENETTCENDANEIKSTSLNETVCINDDTKTSFSTESAMDEELQAELINVKTLLEKEKSEKQILAAKLEFCNDLLLKLYKNN